jgi:hypothetical protein
MTQGCHFLEDALGLGCELRALCSQGKAGTLPLESHPQSTFALGILELGRKMHAEFMHL